jgi:hypothetical protein
MTANPPCPPPRKKKVLIKINQQETIVDSIKAWETLKKYVDAGILFVTVTECEG